MELSNALATHPDLAAVELVLAIPEHRIPFDQFRGEPRNADLALLGRDSMGQVAVTIEAKAEEPYGEMVAHALAAATERRLANPRSKGLQRIEQLAAALLPPHQRGLPRVHTLRYQLLTATAGTLAYAEKVGADRAVMIIHEFITDQTTDAAHEANQRNLNAFVARLTAGVVNTIPDGDVLRPFSVPGRPLFDTPARLYLGKVSRRLRGLVLPGQSATTA